MSKAFWRGFWEGANPLFLLACALYWAGDLASRIGNRFDSERSAAIWMPVYQWCMGKSFAVQERFGFSGPWQVAAPTSPTPTPAQE